MPMIFFFQNLNILCSFWSIGFLPVRSGFASLGSTCPVRFPVLITLPKPRPNHQVTKIGGCRLV
jgi:hypothetical protein